MGYKLCIAEKPSVGRDIARVLGAMNSNTGFLEGNGYIVTWAIGHLVGLAEPPLYGFAPQDKMYGELRAKAFSELPLFPDAFKLTVLESTKTQFQIVKTLMGRPDVDLIIDCGDMGEEGHILQWLIREKAVCRKEVLRFCATSLTDEAIKKAMSNLRPIHEFSNIITGQFCKKKADWILGMSLSRAMSLKHSNPGYNLSLRVGRVQSPTLYFIVSRYLEAQNFKVTDFYGMKASFSEGFDAFWSKDEQGLFGPSVKDDQGRVLDKPSVSSLAASVCACGAATLTGLNIQKKRTERPQLYDITELQRDANVKYGYPASATLAAAQSLYETYKILSYPRTDSRYITSDLVPYLEDRVKAIGALDKYAPVSASLVSAGLNIDKRIVDDSKVTDHHAIIVTENIKGFDPGKLNASPSDKSAGATNDVLKNILGLVITRILVSFSQPYFYESTCVEVTSGNGVIFKSSGSKPISMGWKAVLNELSGKPPEKGKVGEDMQSFPALSKGQPLHITSCAVTDKKTEPPKLHTEATLLTAMENAGAALGKEGSILKGKGIGTQATRADIIKKLFDSKVAEYQKIGKTNYIIPTHRGLVLIRALPQDLRSPAVTARWETMISDICSGASSENEFMESFRRFVTDMVDKVKESEKMSFAAAKETIGKCCWCGSDAYKYKDKDTKSPRYIYYCSDKCGWRLDTHDKIFIMYLGHHLDADDATRFIASGEITLKCKKKNGRGFYPGVFGFRKNVVSKKTYCNLYLKSAS